MSESAANSTGPRNGLRVIDWTMGRLGAVCSLVLADLGAEVIKLELLRCTSFGIAGKVGGMRGDNTRLPHGGVGTR